MEKSIKITIQEFVKNGGVMEVNRQIFGKEGKPIGWFKEMGGDKNDLFICQNSNSSFPVFPEIFFVKIEVTPIYK